MKNSQLITPNSLKIWVANNIPSQATEKKQIPVEEIARQEEFTWVDHIVLSEYAKELVNIEEFDSAFQEKFSEFLINRQIILDKLMLCDMPPFGKGLFAREGIKKGEIISIYTGIQGTSCMKNLSNYSFNTLLEKLPDNLEIIDAKHAGNDARFIQHLPDIENLSLYLKGGNIGKVATANIKIECTRITSKTNVLKLIAARDITVGEIFGLDYSLDCWLAFEKLPVFFDNTGLKLTDVQPWCLASLKIRNLSSRFQELIVKHTSEFLIKNYVNNVLKIILDVEADQPILSELAECKLGKDPIEDTLEFAFSMCSLYEINYIDELIKEIKENKKYDFVKNSIFHDFIKKHGSAKVIEKIDELKILTCKEIETKHKWNSKDSFFKTDLLKEKINDFKNSLDVLETQDELNQNDQLSN